MTEAWLKDAFEAVASKGQLMVALELFRLWLKRKPDSDYVVASNVKLGVPRKLKYRTITALREAGLIGVTASGNGRALKVRVLLE